jgi:hypothetical protein
MYKMTEPTRQILARIAEASYGTGSVPNYQRDATLSSPDIGVYRNGNVVVIAHRGTDVNSPTIGKQLSADFKILLGNKKSDTLHRQRGKKTEDIIRKLRATSPDDKIYLVGHSLGGSSGQNAMTRPYVRANIEKFNSFNAGSSILGGKELAPSGKAYQEIAKKSTHHHIKGDRISENVDKSMIGRVIKYNSKAKPSVSKQLFDLARPLLEKSKLGAVASLAGESIFDTLNAHSLKNFY